MAEFRKVKCVICGYEMATKSETPRCSPCGSRRFNEIEEFTAINQRMAKKPDNKEKQAKPKKEEATQKREDNQEKPKKGFFDDVDEDLWG